MTNGIEENIKISNLRVVHVQAGCYQINVTTTFESDNLDEIREKVKKDLIEISKKIIVDKPLVNIGEVM